MQSSSVIYEMFNSVHTFTTCHHTSANTPKFTDFTRIYEHIQHENNYEQ